MGKNKVRSGVTLIELMTVVMIVAILAAVAVPLMQGRIDSAKWSEGKAIMCTIATSLRAYGAEKGEAGIWPPSLAQLGFVPGDLTGTYFVDTDFTWTTSYVATADPPLTFTITCTPTTTTMFPPTVTLNHLGVWTP